MTRYAPAHGRTTLIFVPSVGSERYTRDLQFAMKTGRDPVTVLPARLPVFPAVDRVERMVGRARRAWSARRVWWGGHVTEAIAHVLHGDCDDGDDW